MFLSNPQPTAIIDLIDLIEGVTLSPSLCVNHIMRNILILYAFAHYPAKIYSFILRLIYHLKLLDFLIPQRDRRNNKDAPLLKLALQHLMEILPGTNF